jgi:soluble lytic murein transglycosylase-like protein
LLAVAAVLTFTLAPGANAGDRSQAARAEARIGALRSQLEIERRRHRQDVIRLRRTPHAPPSVDHALRLAAAAYGVPAAKLRRVAQCESTLNPKATNGRYVGLFQFGTPLWKATPYGRFSRADPYAAAAAAAWALKRGMARHWPLCGRR